MKKNKWITLLSVALGATVVLAACDDKGKEDNYKTPAAAPTVEATFSNFIKAEYNTSAVNYSKNASSLSKQYGTLKQVKGDLYLFCKWDRTPLDEMEQIWTLYDAKEQKAVWTKAYAYQNGDYEGKDEYDNDKQVPLEVTATIDGKFDLPYVAVTVKEYRKYTAEEMQAQIDMALKESLEGGFKSYEVKTTYEYYSVDGKYICTSASDLYGDIDEWSESTLLFGRTCARFDNEAKLVETWNVETTDKIAFSEEVKDYIYSYSMRDGYLMYEVYNKKDNSLVYSYAVDTSVMGAMEACVLQDGDMLLQTKTITYGANYTYVDGDTKYLLETKRVDVETGKTEALDFPYVIENSYSKEDFEEKLADELTLTENVYNVFNVTKIENGEKTTTAYLFVDNLINVQYEWSSMYHGHKFGLSNIDVLKSGDLLINLNTPLEIDGADVTRAIITTSGELVSYVAEDAIVTDHAIIADGKIYDYSGNVLFKMDKQDWAKFDSNYLPNWEVKGYFANGIVWGSSYVSYPGTATEKTNYRTYVVMHNPDKASKYDGNHGTSYDSKGFFKKDFYNSQFIEATDSYLVVYNTSEKVYEVYDGTLERVFKSTQQPTITVNEESLIITIGTGDDRQIYQLAIEEEVPEKENEQDGLGGLWK